MKTDNSHFSVKVLLREKAVQGMENPKVLECFSGKSRLWEEVKKRTGKEIDITRIEKERKKCPYPHLQGDNLKFVLSMGLDRYDIIDLDAYGIPSDLIEVLSLKQYKGIICVTAIQSMQGRMPNTVLNALGYTDDMISKTPTLFSRKGLEKFLKYLYIKGIRKVSGYFFEKKYYFNCKMEA